MFDKNKITQEDLVDKGVTGLADTPNLSTAAMQQKFDELSKDVVIPKFNELVQALMDAGLDKDVKADAITHIRVNKDGMMEYSEDGGKTFNGTGSSGHLILNGANAVFPTRSRLQFSANVGVEDKPNEGITFISVPSGIQGEKGEAATVQIGAVTEGETATVTNVGSTSNAVLDFTLPKGVKGDSATIRVGTVSKGETASVSNRGTANAAVLDFVLPKGDKGDDGTSFTILGSYATYEELIAAHPTGTRGAAYAVGDSDSNVIYNWNVTKAKWDNLGSLKGAKGDKGDAATLAIGTVTSGTVPAVENVGTSNDAILNITLPQGLKGDIGETATVAIGKVTKGTTASVVNVGTPNNAVFDFVLPQGDPATVNGVQADENGNINVTPESIGAMKTATYDSNGSGVVDNAEKLSGKALSYFQPKSDSSLTTTAKTVPGAINELNGKSVDTLTTIEQVEAATDSSVPVGAGAIKELNQSLSGLSFGQDAEGNWGYKVGASTEITPFKSGGGINIPLLNLTSNTNASINFDVTNYKTLSIESWTMAVTDSNGYFRPSIVADGNTTLLSVPIGGIHGNTEVVSNFSEDISSYSTLTVNLSQLASQSVVTNFVIE